MECYVCGIKFHACPSCGFDFEESVAIDNGWCPKCYGESGAVELEWKKRELEDQINEKMHEYANKHKVTK